MNDMTHRYCPPELKRKLDREIHSWLLSERDGGKNTKLSYVKVDVLTDTLNKLFGPLGWGVEAKIQDKQDFEYDKPGYQGAPATPMYVYQVISEVKLTIKPQTEADSPTVFIQSGIGYGEVKVNGHRKDAVGMAVKGAESDGLKRCCNFLGRALGMFLVGGKQDPVVYAHNGNKNQSVVQRARQDRDAYEDEMHERRRRRQEQEQRRQQEEAASGGQGGDAGDRQEQQDRSERQDGDRAQTQDDRQSDDRGTQHRGDQSRDQGRGNQTRGDDRGEDARGRQEGDRQESRDGRTQQRDDRDDRQRDERTQDDAGRGRGSQQRGDGGQERADEARGQDDASTEGREPGQSRRRSSARSGGEAAGKGDAAGKGESSEKGDAAGKGDAPKPQVKSTRKANTNYDLRSVPVTRENQQDFGATFIKQIEGMRQPEDQKQLLKNYAPRINELDPDVRALIVERLRQRDVDVTLLD